MNWNHDIFKVFLLLLVLLSSRPLCAKDWELSDVLNKRGPSLGSKDDVGKPLETYFTGKGSDALFIKQKGIGSHFVYVRNKKWPKLKNFEYSFKFKFHVPEGAQCHETPMLQLIFNQVESNYNMFYRGFQMTNFHHVTKPGRRFKKMMVSESHMNPINADKWYGVKLIRQGRIVKARCWEYSKGEPKRWDVECDMPSEPREGSFALAYKSWTKQKGTEIDIQEIKIIPYSGPALSFLDDETRPERTLGTTEGRAFVGKNWMSDKIKDCKWPVKRMKTPITVDWESLISKIKVPKGFAPPKVANGKLILTFPKLVDPNQAKVVWLGVSTTSRSIGEYSLTCSEGLTPLLWHKTAAKNKKEPSAAAYFDPFYRDDLAAFYSFDSNTVVSFGSNHLLKGESTYRFGVRSYNGLYLYYGTPEEVAEVLHCTTPSWKKVIFGISSKGQSGTIEISPFKLPIK